MGSWKIFGMAPEALQSRYLFLSGDEYQARCWNPRENLITSCDNSLPGRTNILVSIPVVVSRPGGLFRIQDTAIIHRNYEKRIFLKFTIVASLQWRQNGRDGVSNHQPHHRLLMRLFRCRSKKTSKVRVIGLSAGNSPVTGEFPAQMASNAEKFPFDDVIMLDVFLSAGK